MLANLDYHFRGGAALCAAFTLRGEIQHFQKHQDRLLSEILSLDKKIDTIIEKQE
jgi:hypothetical protein